jgi:hypothetical protein
MTANQWQLVEEILLAALEKKGKERSNYLNDVCDGNGDLKREVDSLLPTRATALEFSSLP